MTLNDIVVLIIGVVASIWVLLLASKMKGSHKMRW